MGNGAPVTQDRALLKCKAPDKWKRFAQSDVLTSVRRENSPELGEADLFGLQALRSLGHDKRHLCAFVQRTIPARFDRGKMHENVFAVFTRNKSESFSCVEPLYGSCFFHEVLFSSVGNPGVID